MTDCPVNKLRLAAPSEYQCPQICQGCHCPCTKKVFFSVKIPFLEFSAQERGKWEQKSSCIFLLQDKCGSIYVFCFCLCSSNQALWKIIGNKLHSENPQAVDFMSASIPRNPISSWSRKVKLCKTLLGRQLHCKIAVEHPWKASLIQHVRLKCFGPQFCRCCNSYTQLFLWLRCTCMTVISNYTRQTHNTSAEHFPPLLLLFQLTHLMDRTNKETLCLNSWNTIRSFAVLASTVNTEELKQAAVSALE